MHFVQLQHKQTNKPIKNKFKYMNKENLIIFGSCLVSLLLTLCICLPLYLLPQMKLPYNYNHIHQLKINHDTIVTVPCILEINCSELGCDHVPSYCSSVNVWLTNPQTNSTCNKQYLKDDLQTLMYLLDHDYKQDKIITNGYTHKTNANECTFDLKAANDRLVLVIIFATLLPFFILWLCIAGNIIERFRRGQIILLKSNPNDVELVNAKNGPNI